MSLLSHGQVTAGSVEILEVPAGTTVHVCKALHQDHPLLQGFMPQGFDGGVGHKMFLQLYIHLKREKYSETLGLLSFFTSLVPGRAQKHLLPFQQTSRQRMVSPCLPTSPTLPQAQPSSEEFGSENAHVERKKRKKERKQVKLAFGEKFLWKKSYMFPKSKMKKKSQPSNSSLQSLL